MWKDLEAQVGDAPRVSEEISKTAAQPFEDVAGVVRRSPPRQGRRVFRSSYVS